MTTFDPTAAGATTAFTDGVTSVPANYLDAVELRFASGKAAFDGLATGATGLIVDQNPTVRALEPLVETAITGSYTDGEWAINATTLWIIQGGTGLIVEGRDIDDFAVFAPALEYTASWPTGSIRWIACTDLYLLIAGPDTTAGVDKIDVIDITAGALTGTYSLPASHVTLSSAPAVFYGDNALVHMYDGTSAYKIAAIDLALASIDAGWATAGFLTLTYASGHLAIDQRRLFHFSGDDVEAVNPDTGVSIFTQAGLGTGTTFAYAARTDGQGRVLTYQATGSEYLAAYRVDDAGSLVSVYELTMTLGHSAALHTDGEWILLRATTGDVVTAFSARDGALWGAGPDGWTVGAVGALRWDGLHYITPCQSAQGASVDGFARLKSPSPARRVRKMAVGAVDRGPYSIGLAPVP